MQTRQRSSTWWGLLVTLAIHGLLLGGWQVAAWQKRRVSASEPSQQALQIRILPSVKAPAPSPAPPPPPQRAPSQATEPPPPPQPQPPAAAPQEASPAVAATRDAIHYYFPEEVDRELMLRRDPVEDAPIDLPRPVVLHLFVDAAGRMNAVTVEDAALDAGLQEQLRAAFMQLEFLPALRGGQPVAARMRIEVRSGAGVTEETGGGAAASAASSAASPAASSAASSPPAH